MICTILILITHITPQPAVRPYARNLVLIDLTPEDIANLPAGLHEKIGESLRTTGTGSGAWLLVGDKSEGLTQLIERTVETLPSFAACTRPPAHRGQYREDTRHHPLGHARAAVETALDIENARLRSHYLRETPLLTAAEVRAASGLEPRNRSEPASRWKREGKLFAVRRSGIDLYPAFQFADGAPRPAIKSILTALPNDMTGWQIALWFASANGWLDGAAPQDRLSDPDAVVEAARRLADPAVG